MPDINIQGYDNEDIVRTWIIATGTATTYTPYDLTDCALQMDILNETGERLLRLTSDETDRLIEILNVVGGEIRITIPKDTIIWKKKQSLHYDMLLIVNNAVTHRLWGGKVDIKDGTTNKNANNP